MNDQLAERIAVALEQIAAELVEANAKLRWMQELGPGLGEAVPQPLFPPIGGGQPPAPWVCPVHGTSRTVPAGVSKKTGKPYDAFIACNEFSCNEKPPRIGQPAPQRAVPASQGIQGAVLP